MTKILSLYLYEWILQGIEMNLLTSLFSRWKAHLLWHFCSGKSWSSFKPNVSRACSDSILMWNTERHLNEYWANPDWKEKWYDINHNLRLCAYSVAEWKALFSNACTLCQEMIWSHELLRDWQLQTNSKRCIHLMNQLLQILINL